MRYLAKKIIEALITIFIVTIIVFLAIHSSGDPINSLLPDSATEAQRQELTEKLGLDRPLVEQYGRFVKDALSGDLGTSYTSKRPVLEMIAEKLPYTFELALVAIIIAFIVTIIFGSLAAIWKNTILDRIILAIAAFFKASPIFFIAILAVQLLGVKLRVLPVAGAGTPLHLVMPAGLLGLAIASDMTTLLRSNMIAVLESDFIKFGRLRGLPEYKVILKHALRNSFSSVLALSSFIFASLISGSIVVETIFAWPGVGILSYNSVISRDFPVVQGIVLILSILTILLSFTMDALLAMLDPRIRKSV
ncbi:MAG: ABC transporter permease [Lachnospiraceae bacterium]|nr:ABC transporter permease [Lachnospiraceae bacterium]MCR5701690.1 ABC transporter permease [Lachnospiraceae bacterium]